MNGGISFRVGLILYIARKRSSLSRRYSNMYGVILFSLKLINFLNCCFKKSRYRLAVAPESPKQVWDFCSLTKMRWFGEEGYMLWTRVALFVTSPSYCCFCLCLNPNPLPAWWKCSLTQLALPLFVRHLPPVGCDITSRCPCQALGAPRWCYLQ